MCDLFSHVLKRFKTKHKEPKKLGSWGWLKQELQYGIGALLVHMHDRTDPCTKAELRMQNPTYDLTFNYPKYMRVSKGFREMTRKCRAAEISRLSSGFSPYTLSSTCDGWIAAMAAETARVGVCETELACQEVRFKEQPDRRT